MIYNIFSITMILLFASSGLCEVTFLKTGYEEMLLYDINVNGKQYHERSFGFLNKNLCTYIAIGDYTNASINKTGGFHKWNITTYKDGTPYEIHYAIGTNNVKINFDKSGTVTLTGIWNGKECKTQKTFYTKVTMDTSSLVRSLDFSKNDKLIFDLIILPSLPEIKTYQMYFQIIGDETVKVAAGTFKCKKVLLSLTGLKGFFFKAYYYLTDDTNRYIVKIDNLPIGGETQLVNYSYKKIKNAHYELSLPKYQNDNLTLFDSDSSLSNSEASNSESSKSESSKSESSNSNRDTSKNIPHKKQKRL